MSQSAGKQDVPAPDREAREVNIRISATMKTLRIFALSYPVVLPLAFMVTWLAGRISLGHWPRPSLDDPKFIGGWVDLPYAVTGCLVVAGLPAFLGAVAGMLVMAVRDMIRRKRWLVESAVSISGMTIAVSLLRWDPFGIVACYFD